MRKTYDQYLLEQKYEVYFAFGKIFSGKSEALEYVICELSRQGRLVKVACGAVPDCACQSCGEMLFDWQERVGDSAGSKGEDECWFSLSDGLVCTKCALNEAELELYEQDLPGTDLMETDLI